MNDFTELERQLKQLRPCAPSSQLARQVETAMDQPAPATRTAGVLEPPRSPRVNWLAILSLGAAAAIALLAVAQLANRQPSSAAEKLAAAASPAQANVRSTNSAFLPEELTRVVYDTRDEGLVFSNGAEPPVRRVRSRTQQTMQWRNPSTGASLRVSYPSEEVRLIPVSGQ